MIDRRTLITSTAAAVAASALSSAAGAKAPPGFLWGTAGAAYQIEGGNVASDLWAMEHVKPTLFPTPSGDADDVYNRFEQDIAMAASFGFNAHRLSIEWSRIEPEQGQISQAGLDYYRRVLETCRKHGLAPVVTYIHATTPRWFAAGGGFTTTDGIAPFVAYCDLVTRHMGDLMEAAATFNEPNINALLSWAPEMRTVFNNLPAVQQAIATALGSPHWQSALTADFRVQQPIMIEAHARAYDAIKAASGGRYPVGICLALIDDQPFNGDMTGVLLKRSQVLTPWLNAPGDFVGVQNYSSSIVGPTSNMPDPPGTEVTQMGYAYAPQALEAVIRMVATQTRRPIYVTENGIGTEDDTRRVAFIKRAVEGVQNCLADGIDLRSYIHWSLLDNWEWTRGYGPKFGLVAVDRQSFARTPKPSASYLGQVAKTGRVV
jgi:beta-glucosidase